jgi:hypothetical protein
MFWLKIRKKCYKLYIADYGYHMQGGTLVTKGVEMTNKEEMEKEAGRAPGPVNFFMMAVVWLFNPSTS